MDNVNNLLEGASPYQVLQDQAGKLAGKWDKSGLLEGIESSTEQNNMAILLENQAKQLVNEASATTAGTTISTGAGEAWAGVALPLVRRVFGEIVAKDLISVQPMNLPAGLIFYLDFQYGSAQNFKSAGESLYGATADLKRTDGNFNKGLYGAGEFGYSVTQSAVTAQDSVGGYSASLNGTTENIGGGAAGYAKMSILNMDTEFSASHAGEFGGGTGATSVVRRVAVNDDDFTDFDPEAVRSFTISGTSGATEIQAVFPQFIRAKNGHIEFVVSELIFGSSILVTPS